MLNGYPKVFRRNALQEEDGASAVFHVPGKRQAGIRLGVGRPEQLEICYVGWISEKPSTARPTSLKPDCPEGTEKLPNRVS